MSTTVQVEVARPATGPFVLNLPPIPPLENGDYLTRDEFERRYHAMPETTKAELIEGRVYMSSPVRYRSHGKPDRLLNGWLMVYETFTPGVAGANNSTVRLDWINEPQPDGVLIIDEYLGGQTTISADDYLEGAPELVVEVSASTVSHDLRAKKLLYQRSGVREYIVWAIYDQQLNWFKLAGGEYVPLLPDDDGIIRSHTFPGLWLDVAALLQGDMARVLAVAQQGVASAAHAAFVERLSETPQ